MGEGAPPVPPLPQTTPQVFSHWAAGGMAIKLSQMKLDAASKCISGRKMVTFLGLDQRGCVILPPDKGVNFFLKSAINFSKVSKPREVGKWSSARGMGHFVVVIGTIAEPRCVLLFEDWDWGVRTPPPPGGKEWGVQPPPQTLKTQSFWC